MIDLNRVFPGDPDGLLTHQLAHNLFQLFSTQCEYFVDFHCGGIFPTVDYVYVHGDEGLARSVGSRLLYVGEAFAGSLTFCLENEGLHTTAIELGGGRANSISATKRASEALMRVLMYIGAVKGDLEPRHDQIMLDQMRVIRPHHGGLLISEIELSQLGSFLPKDSVVGRVIHPQTLDTLEVLSTPFDPSVVVLAREGITPVGVGEYAFMFGRPVQ
jgi:predicted deacylase